MQKTTLLLTAAFTLAAFNAEAGNITGTISFKGKPPAAKAIDMSSDPKCKSIAKDAKTNEVVVNGGKLADVFVYVKNPPKKKYKPRTQPSLDQKGCRYHPKVFGVMKKQKFTIINSDPTLHNVHAFAKRGEFNQAMPKQGQKIKKKFKKEQVLVHIKCDVHSWMSSYAGVLEHPFFAVSGSDGSFKIDTTDLKDGEYEIIAHHPTLGEKKGKVKVAGGNASVDFAFGK